MKPVCSKGSSGSADVGGGGGGRSEVESNSGESWARRWNMWWVCVCLSSMTRPHEVHSVMLRPAAVVVHRPCDGPAEQYGHFIFG